ncbi:FAD-binding dehydrogenase [Zhengella mangrovi]|uniref:FAD-binding dehydrogenase n=1 Tax=Zhengella mangrovi TaxID=1982044 RepID=A0A2G1QI79_9HYPH|nr:FAD-dependent oxidoreductase [Zhengella mangrovi]PHP65189.1 FAD-binding dehydrogenase [Zhengella mangrovi]
MTSPSSLPDSADVVIVGSGAAGLCAAITLKLGGLEPVILEKTSHFGGSTAVSGGAVWIPGNPHSEDVGHHDTREAAMAYLEAEIGNRLNRPVVEAFLDNGPDMVRFLEANTAVRFAARATGPDYHPDLPGGTLGGRVMDPLDYDGRELGANFDKLRPPIDEFTILGGMMVGRTDLGHLPKMLRDPKSFLYATRVVARHLLDRMTHKRGTRLVLGNALAARLGKTVFDLGIPLLLDSPLTGIEKDAEGRVAAVRSGDARIETRHGVILAAGGFPSNDGMRKAHVEHAQSSAHYSMSPAGNTGDAIMLGSEAGGTTGRDNLHPAFWTPVSRLKRADGTTVSFPHLFLDRAKPGLIAVTAEGSRFVNESASYHDFVSGMIDVMRAGGETRFHLVCDHRFIRRYGLGAVRPFPGRIAPFLESGYLARGETIAELEGRLGLPKDALVRTVDRYNSLAAAGEDSDFHKGGSAYNRYLGDPENKPNPCLRPIDQGPFYAVQVWPGDIGTSIGLVTDASARVLDGGGEPVPGLFACGNDMNSIMAGSYPGPGITLGPALTFGYIAAKHILEHKEALKSDNASASMNR